MKSQAFLKPVLASMSSLKLNSNKSNEQELVEQLLHLQHIVRIFVFLLILRHYVGEILACQTLISDEDVDADSLKLTVETGLRGDKFFKHGWPFHGL